jgi:hypothetical protein
MFDGRLAIQPMMYFDYIKCSILPVSPARNG